VAALPNTDYHGVSALVQTLMVDTTHYRDGTDLVPDGPMPDVWWENTSVPGLNAYPELQNSDVAVWLTVGHDISLGATDTLNYWTVLTTTRNADLTTLSSQVSAAKTWWNKVVNADYACVGGCCVDRVGDANNSGADEPTIGDVSFLIDALFIGGDKSVLECLAECDVNQSGGTDPTEDDITIGDVSYLIDYLFITGTSLGLPACL
jgi:hypothetical protein